MNCLQCQTKHEYNTSCHDCAVRLIVSAFPVGDWARLQTEYVRSYFKTDIEPVIKEAREKWKCLKSR
jgi:hypothetical protein